MEKSASRRWDGLILAILIAMTAAVYWQVKDHRFLSYDDGRFITGEPRVMAGLTWEGFCWAMTSMIEYWGPLTRLSHMLDCQLFGLDPRGHLAVNVILHGVNSLLIFFVLRKMTGASWRSGFVAALFAVHPLCVESVAWATERKDVLSTFFWLLAIGAYVRCAGAPASWKRFCWVIGLFALGLMAKPVLVTLPFVLLLLDYWPLDRLRWQNWPRCVREKIPLFVLSGLLCALTLVAVRSYAVPAIEDSPFLPRLGAVVVAYASYVVKMLWPIKLAIVYPHAGNVPAPWEMIGAGIFLGAVCFLAWRHRRCHPYLLVGWLWYLGTFVPMIGFLQGVSQADRHAYVPLVGLFMMGAWGASDLWERFRLPKAALAIMGAAVLLLLIVRAREQTSCWHDTHRLFEHALKAYPNNWMAHRVLGITFAQEGNIDLAIAHVQEEVRIKPRSAKGHVYLGNLLAGQGRLAEAIHHFREALKVKPRYAPAHNSLGLVLARQGKGREARVEYEAAISGDARDAHAHNNFANLLAAQGEISSAVQHYSEALRIAPDFADAHYNLGNLWMGQGDWTQAIAYLTKACQLAPQDPDAHCNLGIALARSGQAALAMDCYRRALAINPGHAVAKENLANVSKEPKR